MKLLTKTIRDQMIANGKAQDAVRGTEDEIDFEPVVKLFNPCGAGTWLLTELDSEDPDIAFVNLPHIPGISAPFLPA